VAEALAWGVTVAEPVLVAVFVGDEGVRAGVDDSTAVALGVGVAVGGMGVGVGGGGGGGGGGLIAAAMRLAYRLAPAGFTWMPSSQNSSGWLAVAACQSTSVALG
jgi:hypothetical protein